MLNNETIQLYIQHLDSILADSQLDHEEKELHPDAYGILARSRTLVHQITGPNSFYTQEFERIYENYLNYPTYRKKDFPELIGIVKSLRNEVSIGFLESITQLIHARLFADYLEMAEYLLTEGYKDASAVIAGSTLEAHLRRLAEKSGVSFDDQQRSSSKHMPASRINQELGKKIYTLYDQKQVTAWLDLRNSAAHGNYSNYTSDQISLMIEGIKDFIERYPA